MEHLLTLRSPAVRTTPRYVRQTTSASMSTTAHCVAAAVVSGAPATCSAGADGGGHHLVGGGEGGNQRWVDNVLEGGHGDTSLTVSV